MRRETVASEEGCQLVNHELPDDNVRIKTDHGLAILDALADTWAAEVNLTAMIKNAVSPMRLNRGAPDDVRERFTARMEAQIDAIARQAFQEGAYRAITGLQDEREAMAKLDQRPQHDKHVD
jgi:hypothetical protein